MENRLHLDSVLFKFLNNQNIHFEYAKEMLPIIYQHPKIEFESVLTTLNFKKRTEKQASINIPLPSKMELVSA